MPTRTDEEAFRKVARTAPVARLPSQDWMQWQETMRVVAALTRDRAEVRFVGGCVRDAVAGRRVSDIDVATVDRPDVVITLLQAAGIRAVPTGIDHGTVTAICDGRTFEVTTLRRDVETDGRRARVEFTDDWVADAARRDFTINALSCAPDGRLYDPFDGIADLRAGVVRFVGDPVRRIEEDVLRLLRYFRFFATYGKPPPDPASVEACARMSDRLPTLSGERVRAELLRLLVAPNAIAAIRLMLSRQVLAHLLPEAMNAGRLEGLIGAEAHVTAAADGMLRLLALVETDVPGGSAMAARLRLSREETRRMTEVVAERAADLGTDGAGIRRALHRLGVSRFRDLSLLQAAEDGDLAILERRWIEAEGWTPRALPVTGRDVVALGVHCGPEVGRLLRSVEDWWIGRDFADGRPSCLEYLRSLIRIP